jgi:hypothetical protein
VAQADRLIEQETLCGSCFRRSNLATQHDYEMAERVRTRQTTINALAIEAFNDLLKKYGKRQSVENPLLDD